MTSAFDPRPRTPLSFVLLAAAALAACGGTPDGDGAAVADAGSAPSTSNSDAELTAVELEQGIGPVRDLNLEGVDPALAEAGEAAFTQKCSACHKVEERYVGPRLGTVLSRRRPEFVMNMVLNANEMVKRHPVVKELLGQFYTPMPVQVTDPDEARAILEYLRSVQTDSTASSPADPAGDR